MKSLNLDRIIPSTPGRRTADLSESAFFIVIYLLLKYDSSETP